MGFPNILLRGKDSSGNYHDVLTDTLGQLMVSGGGGGGGGTGNSLAVITYYASSAFTGASIGDTITCTQVISAGTTPAVVGVLWFNQTTGLALSGAPAATNLVLLGEGYLTASQLGTNSTGVTQLTGGTGILGWLSGIFSKLSGYLSVNLGIGSAAVSSSNPVPMNDAFLAPVTKSFASSTPIDGSSNVLQSTTSGYDTVILTVVPTGTVTSAQLYFEVYDGVTWLPIKAARIESYNTEQNYSATTANGFRAWQIPVAGFPAYRTRLNATLVGSGSVGITHVVSSAPDTSVVTVGLDPATTVGNASDSNATISSGALPTSSNLQGFNGTTWDRIRAGITGVVSSITGFLATNPFGTYLVTPPTLTNGQSTGLQMDASGNLKVLASGGATSALQAQISAQLPTALGGTNVAGSLAVSNPRKLAVTGYASVAVSTTYANLLDSAAGATATDVRDYNTALLTIVSTAATGSYTIQGSFDSGGTIGLVTLQAQEITVQTGAAVINGAITPTASTRVFRVPITDINYLRVTLGTGVTSGTLQAYATLSQAVPVPTELTVVQATAGNLNFTPAANSGINIAQVGGTTGINSAANGSSNKALGTILANAVNQVDQAATAFAGAGRVQGTVVASAAGGGVSCAFDINVTVTTLGTATALLAVLQESYDGGTTHSDIWTSFPFTTSQHIRVPAIPIAGRRKWALHSVGGTSTTVPITITAQELPSQPKLQRQFVDVYSATNPFASIINGTTYTSALVSTTLNSTSAVAIMEGCSAIELTGVFTGGTPTTAPIYTLQVSMDATNWLNTKTTLSPTAAGTFAATYNGSPYKYARVIVSTASAGGTPYGVTYIALNGSEVGTISNSTLDAPSVNAPAQGWPSLFSLAAAATTNATVIKATAGTLGSIMVTPSSGTLALQVLKIYDKATAPVVNDTPKIMLAYSNNSYPNSVQFPLAGIKFTNGISIAIVTTTSNATFNAVAADSLVVNLAYA